MEALRLKPVAYYLLSDTSPYQDHSGYNRNSLQTGTTSTGLSLVSDATVSRRVYSGNHISFEAPIYQKGRESKDFSISAVVFPIVMGSDSEQQVVSHGDNMDGITIEGKTIRFSTKYLSGGSAVCEYQAQFLERFDVVGVHTSSKNSLYVNGILVDEVDITSEQLSSEYDVVDSLFYSGKTSGVQRLFINAVGFYSKALSNEEVISLYRNNWRTTQGTVSKSFGGELIDINKSRIPFIDISWDSDEEWRSGISNNVSVESDAVFANIVNNLTQSGTWASSVDLYNNEQAQAINSITIYYDAKNFNIKSSVDNSASEQNVVSGKNLSISNSFDPTDKSLRITAEASAGVTEAYINNIRVKAFIGNTAVSQNRLITYSNPVVHNYSQPVFNMSENDGIELTGGTLTIGTDTISDSPVTPKTIEVIMRRKSDSTLTLSSNLSSATSYSNGASGSSQNRGEWVIRHFVNASGITGDISISGDVQIVSVSAYPTALTQQEITKVVNSYTGINKISYNDTGIIAVAEPPQSSKIYAHDWEIQSA